jgi:hypothetical protein
MKKGKGILYTETWNFTVIDGCRIRDTFCTCLAASARTAVDRIGTADTVDTKEFTGIARVGACRSCKGGNCSEKERSEMHDRLYLQCKLNSDAN